MLKRKKKRPKPKTRAKRVKALLSEETLQKEESLDSLGLYQPKEREIYRYFNGKEVISADPLTLYKRVMDHGEELDANIKASTFPGFAKATEAHNDLISDLRKIFDIEPVEKGGLTEVEMEDLLTHFLKYCEIVKKNWSMIPMPRKGTSTSTQRSVPPSAPTPEKVGSPPISNTSDSGSTDKGLPIEEQNPLPLEPESPTVVSTQAWSIGEIPPMESPKPSEGSYSTEQQLADNK